MLARASLYRHVVDKGSQSTVPQRVYSLNNISQMLEISL